MLSRTAEHAIRAVLYLAREAGEEPVPASDVARAIGAPRNYLSKTLHQLAKAGVVRARPGRNGGFGLAVPAGELTLSRILEVFEDPPSDEMCLLGDRPCDPADPCGAHHRWTRVTETSRAPFEGTTVADFLD